MHLSLSMSIDKKQEASLRVVDHVVEDVDDPAVVLHLFNHSLALLHLQVRVLDHPQLDAELVADVRVELEAIVLEVLLERVGLATERVVSLAVTWLTTFMKLMLQPLYSGKSKMASSMVVSSQVFLVDLHRASLS